VALSERTAAMSTFMKDCDAAKASSDVMGTRGDSRFINLWVKGRENKITKSMKPWEQRGRTSGH